MLKRLLSAYNLERCPALSWGITNERAVIDSYILLGASVEETGVWLHESGAIGASPDGIVTHQPHMGILHLQTEAVKYLEAEPIEVKCPYSAKDMKIKDAVETVPGFFLLKQQTGICT